jgi:tetratricopeptide (TPR) repeat protein
MRMARLPYGTSRWLVSLVTVVAFTAAQVPLAAFAQNSAQAEVLFKEGQQLLQAGKYPEACQRLTASFKLDPQPNTELVQGLCFSKLGKIASAYNAFIDAASNLPRGGDAQKYAADQAKALEGQLLKVKVQMQPVIPPGVAIRFDDETKTRDKDFVDLDIALDPGDHDLYVTAPNKHDYTKHFKLADKEASPHLLIVNMTDLTQAELDAEKNKGGGGGGVTVAPETSWSTVKTLGLISIVVGSVGIAGAVVAQILALVDHANATNKQSDAPSGTCLNLNGVGDDLSNTDCQQAVSYQNQALGSQSAAIGIGIAGGVVLIAGIIMFVAGGNVTKTPEKPAATWHLTPLVSPKMAGLGVVGTF